MIKDNLLNAKIYYNLSQNIQEGLQWLVNTDLKNLSDGRYEVDGEKIFASIQTYETKEDAKYEAHRKYIDIQYLVSGTEQIGVTDIKNCNTCIEYNLEKDIEFFDMNKDELFIKLESCDFLILYPHDAHKPSISVNKEKSLVKKVVVKVLYQ